MAVSSAVSGEYAAAGARGFAAWLWRRHATLVPARHTGRRVARLHPRHRRSRAGFVGGLETGTETDAFCTSCHEMQAALSRAYAQRALFQCTRHSAELRQLSRAAEHSCQACGATFEAAGEVWGHLRGELNTPAKYEAHRLELAQKMWTEMKSNDSAECRSCHTASAMNFAKQPPMAASSHQSMAKQGMTCIDCHRGVAHTLPAGN
jgi:cytochrome c-type protein NapC